MRDEFTAQPPPLQLPINAVAGLQQHYYQWAVATAAAPLFFLLLFPPGHSLLSSVVSLIQTWCGSCGWEDV
jgi:hypothetical protein